MVPLCVRAGSRAPAAGLVAGVVCGVMVCSSGGPASAPDLLLGCALVRWSGHSDPGVFGSSAGALSVGQPELGGERFRLLRARALPLWV